MLHSRHNDQIKRARSLLTRKGRERCGAFLVESPRALATVLAAGATVERVLVAGELDLGLADDLARQDIEVLPVTAEVLESVTETVTPSGCVAVVRSPARAAGETPGPLVLVLDEVRDPGNLGTLLRTADAVGADVLLAGGCADPLSPKVVRASAGAVVRVRWWRGGIGAAQARLAGWPHRVVRLEATADVSIYEPLPCPVALVAGNEAHGVAAAWQGQGESRRLPMAAGAESLNVGVAAAVALYEVVRQHGLGLGDDGAE